MAVLCARRFGATAWTDSTPLNPRLCRKAAAHGVSGPTASITWSIQRFSLRKRTSRSTAIA
jgi:hypothetical protein